MRVVTREEMRAIDRWAIETAGIPSIVLMENAGRGVAAVVAKILDASFQGSRLGPILVVCGPGNNGGDGFVAARCLHRAGRRVAVALVGRGDRFDRPGDAGDNFREVIRLGLPVGEIGGAAELRGTMDEAVLLVDALFGTGLTRPVEGLHREVIEAVNAERGPRGVVAVDIPSGLDANEGRPLGVSVRAGTTATMAFPKAGFRKGQGPACCGEVTVIDIGLPRDVPRWDGTRLYV